MKYILVYFNIPKDKKTFTLVEMLIVVVIIGILATALVPRLVNTQSRARDTKRIADVRQIGVGLSIYKSDKGSYPTGQRLTNDFESAGALPLVPNYLTSIPRDSDRSAYSVGLYYTSTTPGDWAGSYNITTSGGYYGYTPFPLKGDSAGNVSFVPDNAGMILVTKVENPSMANWMAADSSALWIIAGEVPSRAVSGGGRWVGARSAVHGSSPSMYNMITPNTTSELTQNLCARMIYTGGLDPYMNAIVATGSWHPGVAAGGNTCYVPQTQKSIIRYLYVQ